MNAQARPQNPPRRPAPAVRPPRAPAHNWNTAIRHHFPLLLACCLLVGASGYALAVHAEPAAVTAQAHR